MKKRGRLFVCAYTKQMNIGNLIKASLTNRSAARSFTSQTLLGLSAYRVFD